MTNPMTNKELIAFIRKEGLSPTVAETSRVLLDLCDRLEAANKTISVLEFTRDTLMEIIESEPDFYKKLKCHKII